jgi:hypothetical protein
LIASAANEELELENFIQSEFRLTTIDLLLT